MHTILIRDALRAVRPRAEPGARARRVALAHAPPRRADLVADTAVAGSGVYMSEAGRRAAYPSASNVPRVSGSRCCPPRSPSRRARAAARAPPTRHSVRHVVDVLAVLLAGEWDVLGLGPAAAAAAARRRAAAASRRRKRAPPPPPPPAAQACSALRGRRGPSSPPWARGRAAATPVTAETETAALAPPRPRRSAQRWRPRPHPRPTARPRGRSGMRSAERRAPRNEEGARVCRRAGEGARGARGPRLGDAAARRGGDARARLPSAATSSAELGISSLPAAVCGSGTLRYAFGRERGIRCDVSVQFGSPSPST